MPRTQKRKRSIASEHERNYLSYAEAYGYTGVRADTWRKWVKQKRISVVRLGRLVKIPRSVIDEFIKNNTVAAQ